MTQQEKEALKQEVMSLHKQLQNASDKVISFLYWGITLYSKMHTVLVYNLFLHIYMYLYIDIDIIFLVGNWIIPKVLFTIK